MLFEKEEQYFEINSLNMNYQEIKSNRFLLIKG